MGAWDLPTSLEIGGVGFSIRTDYRDVLKILHYFDDPEFEDDEKWFICLKILYPDWRKIPAENIGEAIQKAKEFLDGGFSGDERRSKRKLMDWDQDAPIIIPAINKVMGKEIRAERYMHWWTFMSAYMEINEGVFSTVLSIRAKKGKKKLEKWEKEFYAENKEVVDLKRKYTAEELAEQERLNKLLG
ncbi:MAG: hypothetical protein IJM76_05965 [Lachnospiraceae bacterium]|nr:hypothetical protein [Lachnospiraceae bacterium]